MAIRDLLDKITEANSVIRSAQAKPPRPAIIDVTGDIRTQAYSTRNILTDFQSGVLVPGRQSQDFANTELEVLDVAEPESTGTQFDIYDNSYITIQLPVISAGTFTIHYLIEPGTDLDIRFFLLPFNPGTPDIQWDTDLIATSIINFTNSGTNPKCASQDVTLDGASTSLNASLFGVTNSRRVNEIGRLFIGYIGWHRG